MWIHCSQLVGVAVFILQIIGNPERNTYSEKGEFKFITSARINYIFYGRSPLPPVEFVRKDCWEAISPDKACHSSLKGFGGGYKETDSSLKDSTWLAHSWYEYNLHSAHSTPRFNSLLQQTHSLTKKITEFSTFFRHMNKKLICWKNRPDEYWGSLPQNWSFDMAKWSIAR